MTFLSTRKKLGDFLYKTERQAEMEVCARAQNSSCIKECNL